MYDAIVAISFFLVLVAAYGIAREYIAGSSTAVSARDEDAAGKAPRPGVRDRFATNSATLGGAPVPSWG